MRSINVDNFPDLARKSESRIPIIDGERTRDLSVNPI